MNRRQLITQVGACTALGALGLVLPARAQTIKGHRTATWEELIPKGWDPSSGLKDKSVKDIKEGSPAEQALMKELRELWDNAPLRTELEGAKLRLPGYVVPLDQVRGEIKEFLLVPYFGACIHSPPPPANQIVHVVLAKPQPIKSMEAVWASGTMRAKRSDSAMGVSGYRMEGFAVEPYK